jgi:hypothetical protein
MSYFQRAAFFPNIGNARHQIDFEYEPIVDKRTPYDRLILKNFHNVDPKKVRVEVKHDPDNCVAGIIASSDQKQPFYSIEASAASSDKVMSALASFFSLKAWAGFVNEVSPDVLLKAPELSGKARILIGKNPDAYVAAIDRLLSAPERNGPAIITALEGLRDSPAGTFRLPDNVLEKLVRVAYSGPRDIRQAARTYLLDSDVLDENVVRIMRNQVAAAPSLRDTRRTEYTQLMALSRDVFYNAGVKSIRSYRGDFGASERAPGAIADAKRYLNYGVELIDQLAPDENLQFAKALYGKALALFSEAVVSEAERSLGQAATSRRIQDHIFAQIKRSSPIPFSEQGRAEFTATVTRFLSMTEGRDGYLWPEHIAQLRSCRQRLVYSCFSGTVS